MTSTKAATFSRLCVLVFALILVSYLLHSISSGPSSGYPLWRTNAGNVKAHYENFRGDIPSQVHYAFMLKDRHAGFQFKFAQFLSVYSAWYHWRPHTFYIHTDASELAICRAQGLCPDDPTTPTNKWTKLIFGMPNVRVNRVTAPLEAAISKVPITMIEHKADFVRVDALRDLGGILLDWDAFAIRDISPLRKSGFAAIGGREMGGDIQSGTWLTRANSLLIKLWSEQQHVVFDGEWTTHSNRLLTKLGQRLVNLPGEFLIMEQVAFTPGGWNFGEQDYMFRTHEDFPSALGLLNDTVAGDGGSGRPFEALSANGTRLFLDDDLSSPVLERMQHPESFPEWAFDFSSTYMVHAYKIWQFEVEGFKKIDAKYVLRRQSNFARAVWPAAMDAWRQGLIGWEDLEEEE